MTATTIVPARSEPEADRIAAQRRIPPEDYVWCDPAYAEALAARCEGYGVDARVLTARPVARTVVVATQHERSRAA